MPCCGSSGCSCRVTGGAGVAVSGSGTAHDPFIISAGLYLTGADNSPFDVTFTGEGSAESPYEVRVAYSSESILGDIPDVDVASADEGQVLAWDASSGKWRPADPSTAPVGAVATDGTIDGDGSGGDPLSVHADESRGLTIVSTGDGGVGMRDAMINQAVRKFTNTGDRNAADPPATDAGTLTRLLSQPGVIYQWDGAQHNALPIPTMIVVDAQATLELSGPYTAGQKLTHLFKFVEEAADIDGVATLVTTGELAGFGGVLVCHFQEWGGGPTGLYHVRTYGDVNRIAGKAYLLDGSEDSVPDGTTIRGWVDAWLYG